MKEIIKFKNNIFKKVKILPFAEKLSFKNDLSNLYKLKKDLELINDNFSDKYSTREVILLHNDDLPPKSNRCFEDILLMDKNIKYSTSRFKNFKNENIKLEILLNFSKQSVSNSIVFINKVIGLCELILENKEDILIITNTKNYMPSWLLNFLEKNRISKTKISKFIFNIQNYYEKLFMKTSSIKLIGDFFVSFSSLKTKNEFINNNNAIIIEDVDDKKILIKSNNDTIDTTNIISYSKNFKIINFENIASQGVDLPKLPLPNEKNPTIGVLDSSIPIDSPFRNYIKTTNYTNTNNILHHGEAVSSIIYAGDKLNDFDDSCGPFNVHLFEIFEEKITYSTLLKRIRMAIESNQNIKIWNLSINSTLEEAFEDGKITELAAEIDKIQTDYNVLIVQSAGNQKENFKSIMSPSDAIKSLVVNSVKGLNNQRPTNYSLNGDFKYYTKKPDVAFFGGDNENQIKALKNGKIIKCFGTSFATPFVTRKVAHLIYYENYSILEAKALIIHSSFVNSFNNKNNKNGWGVVPNNIYEVLNSKNDQIRFIFNEQIKDTKSIFLELKIPQKKKQEFSVLLTILSSEKLDEKYGCEYVRSAVNVNMGPLDENNKFISHKKLKPHIFANKGGEPILKEKKLITDYNKWKLTNCLKDVIKRDKKGIKKYGITAKIDKRMSEIKNNNIFHNLICIVTLIHNEGIDKYDEFIKNNIKNIVQTNINVEGEIDIKKFFEK